MRAKLDGVYALQAGIFAALAPHRLPPVFVQSRGGQRKVPDRFFRRNVLQPDLSLLSCAWFADPLYTKTALALAMDHADGLANFDWRTNSFELRPFAAHIDGKHIFRESLSMNVGAEDTNGHFSFFSWLPTLTHKPRPIPCKEVSIRAPKMCGDVNANQPLRQVITNAPSSRTR